MEQAFFIGGTGRCGTSILAFILDDHPQLAAILESKFVDEKAFRSFPLMLFPLPVQERIQLIDNFKTYFLNQFYKKKIPTDRLPPGDDGYRGLFRYFSLPEVEKSLCIMDKAASLPRLEDINQCYGRFIRHLFKSYSRRKQKEYWIEKSPNNSIFSGHLFSWFPEFKLVSLIRDGRDVACSVVQQHWGPDEHRPALDWWAQMVTRAQILFDKLGPDHVLQIRYEDLVAQPQKTMKRILCFLEVDDHTDFMGRRELHSNAVGRWKKDLSPELQRYAVEKHGEILGRYGYQHQD